MKNLYIILLFALSLNVYAEQSEKLEQLVKPVFELIEKGKYKNIASTALSKGAAIKYISPADLEQVDGEFENYFKIFGNYYSYKLIHEQGLKGDYWARWYLLKFERQPVVLYFEFYKPNDKWNVNALEIKTDIDDKIEEAGDYKISVIGLEDES
ncbi:hypothetical protein [Marinomonas aquiplantarum]|uniref:DUF4783 domain-containing protein n=1 Tax=Marinomonas aquiplantarum TaxID=491951 RepID=A0A366CVJ6_9GAMM|nr:hypothetical protein [Marinomonas aquiplantarum]RBO81860.1 hypothetical protein DFP76_1073 [Marinomonas aquiplantarum]